MSFAIEGLTHCSKCRTPLGMNLKCPVCEREEKEIRENKLNKLLAFSEDEIDALRVLALDKAEEIRKERIKNQIEKLQRELED